MPETIAIGAVRRLNAEPLIHGLREEPAVTLRLEDAGALGPMLARGEVAAALAPSIEYFRLAADAGERARSPGAAVRGGFVALPVAAIGSRGPVGSVRLFGYTEPARLRRVVLDGASRTSNVLAQILLVRRLGVRPHFVLPEEAARPAAGPVRPPDAELVIGDRALVAARPAAKWVLDLGQEWQEFVHRPFVYAFWMARADAPLPRLLELLAAARDRGLAAREDLARRGAGTLGLEVEAARRYLFDQVRYGFGPKEQDGLRAFYRMAAEEGLAPEGGRLHLFRPDGDDST